MGLCFTDEPAVFTSFDPSIASTFTPGTEKEFTTTVSVPNNADDSLGVLQDAIVVTKVEDQTGVLAIVIEFADISGSYTSKLVQSIPTTSQELKLSVIVVDNWINPQVVLPTAHTQTFTIGGTSS